MHDITHFAILRHFLDSLLHVGVCHRVLVEVSANRDISLTTYLAIDTHAWIHTRSRKRALGSHALHSRAFTVIHASHSSCLYLDRVISKYHGFV